RQGRSNPARARAGSPQGAGQPAVHSATFERGSRRIAALRAVCERAGIPRSPADPAFQEAGAGTGGAAPGTTRIAGVYDPGVRLDVGGIARPARTELGRISTTRPKSLYLHTDRYRLRHVDPFRRPCSPHQKLWTNIPARPLNDGRSPA